MLGLEVYDDPLPRSEKRPQLLGNRYGAAAAEPDDFLFHADFGQQFFLQLDGLVYVNQPVAAATADLGLHFLTEHRNCPCLHLPLAFITFHVSPTFCARCASRQRS